MQDGDQPIRLGEDLAVPAPPEFGVTVYLDKQGRTVIAPRGEIDTLTTPRFGAEIGEIVRSGDRDVVVDLQAVEFIDSTGLHVLLNAQRRLTRARRRMTVVCGASPVRRAIELVKLADTLGLDPSPKQLPPRAAAA